MSPHPASTGSSSHDRAVAPASATAWPRVSDRSCVNRAPEVTGIAAKRPSSDAAYPLPRLCAAHRSRASSDVVARRPEAGCRVHASVAKRKLARRRRSAGSSPLRSFVRRELEHESARAGSRHVAASPGGAGVRSGRRRALPTRPEQPRNRRRCGRHREHAQRQDAQDACDRCAVPKGFGVWVGKSDAMVVAGTTTRRRRAFLRLSLQVGEDGEHAAVVLGRRSGSRAWRRRL